MVEIVPLAKIVMMMYMELPILMHVIFVLEEIQVRKHVRKIVKEIGVEMLHMMNAVYVMEMVFQMVSVIARGI